MLKLNEKRIMRRIVIMNRFTYLTDCGVVRRMMRLHGARYSTVTRAELRAAWHRKFAAARKSFKPRLP